MQNGPHLVSVPGQASLIMMQLCQSTIAPFHGRRGALKRLRPLGSPRFPLLKHLRGQLLSNRMRLKRALHRLQGLSQPGFPARAPCVGHLVCPIESGSKHSCTQFLHMGERRNGSKSCAMPCHQKSTRAARAGTCLRTLAMVSGRAGNAWLWANASIASTAACRWLSTWAEVWGAESAMQKGCSESESVSN